MLEHTIGVMVERCARHYGPDAAIVHGDKRITYAEFISDVRRTGRALLGLGLQRGDRVAILMNDRPELLAVMYGVQWAGLAIVPLNAKLASADHAYILSDSGARVLCHDAAFAPRVLDIREESGVEFFVSVDDEGVLDGGHDFSRLIGAEDDGPGAPEVAADDLVSIFYTGGTTGRPKGVAHSHRTLLAAFISETLEMGLGDRDVFAHVAPMTHAGGAFALPIWMRGGTNLILGGFDPEQLLDAIPRHGVTSSLMVPTMIYVLLEQAANADVDTSSLRTIAYGAAPMGREPLLAALERFGPVFAQLYGQTEAPNQLTVLRKQDHADALASGNHEVLSSCGRPVTIADVRIADDDLRDVAPGEAGEIVARGPHVMLGYWNKPDETAETIRDGWLCTGDIAKTDERGYVYIVDRKKDMIISGGFNVYPKEVEQALFEHPAVRDACVIGIPDEKWGETVKAVVVTDGAELDESDLIGWVKERKGSVLAPKSVDFVEEIPLTAVGKHDKPALRKAYWAGRERAVS
jgi:fatty-acyl-CoA synthase